MAKLALVKVQAEYRVDIQLPDPTSELREKGTQKLKELGCTIFKEHRHYDIVQDVEMLTIRGFKVELLQTYDGAISKPVGWSVG